MLLSVLLVLQMLLLQIVVIHSHPVYGTHVVQRYSSAN